ncbi:hypothetical protein OROMI_014301 [Orobanche minor]
MGGIPPLHQIPTEATVKRNKFLFRTFLVSNFALAAYIFWQSGNKPRRKEKSVVPAEVASVPSAVIAPTESTPVISPPITRPTIVRKTVSEDEQREIFKWMLEEKRKAKPVSREDKRRIDEDKAILKEFIRSNSIPSI